MYAITMNGQVIDEGWNDYERIIAAIVDQQLKEYHAGLKVNDYDIIEINQGAIMNLDISERPECPICGKKLSLIKTTTNNFYQISWDCSCLITLEDRIDKLEIEPDNEYYL